MLNPGRPPRDARPGGSTICGLKCLAVSMGSESHPKHATRRDKLSPNASLAMQPVALRLSGRAAQHFEAVQVVSAMIDSSMTVALAPSVHQMVLTLEANGFIGRVPSQGRSIRLKITRKQLPDLE